MALAFGAVGALPTALNLKPDHYSHSNHLVAGGVRLLHWKPVDVPRALEMCRIVNANRSARVIVGLSRCGLAGDNDIRLKALKPGGAWLNATATP